ETFAIFAGSGFASATGDDGDVVAVHFHVEALILRRFVIVFVLFDFAEDVGAVDELVVIRDAGEIGGEKPVDGGSVMLHKRGFPSVLGITRSHILGGRLRSGSGRR